MSHAGSDILPNGKDITLVIEKLEWKVGEMINGKKQDAWIGHFKSNPYTKLPFVVNSTNMKRLRKLTGLESPELLTNFAVIMTREITKDPQDGGETWGLRVSKVKAKQTQVDAPKEKDVLTISSENFEDIKGWLSGENHKLSVIINKYDVEESALVELRKIKTE